MSIFGRWWFLSAEVGVVGGFIRMIVIIIRVIIIVFDGPR